jgi:hypothetical protein
MNGECGRMWTDAKRSKTTATTGSENFINLSLVAIIEILDIIITQFLSRGNTERNSVTSVPRNRLLHGEEL